MVSMLQCNVALTKPIAVWSFMQAAFEQLGVMPELCQAADEMGWM